MLQMKLKSFSCYLGLLIIFTFSPLISEEKIVKGNILLYKSNILFEVDNRYEVSKFDGSYRLLSKKLVYVVEHVFNFVIFHRYFHVVFSELW